MNDDFHVHFSASLRVLKRDEQSISDGMIRETGHLFIETETKNQKKDVKKGKARIVFALFLHQSRCIVIGIHRLFFHQKSLTNMILTKKPH